MEDPLKIQDFFFKLNTILISYIIIRIKLLRNNLTHLNFYVKLLFNCVLNLIDDEEDLPTSKLRNNKSDPEYGHSKL